MEQRKSKIFKTDAFDFTDPWFSVTRKNIYTVILMFFVLTACTDQKQQQQQEVKAPHASCRSHQGYFDTQVWPIFQKQCISCHEKGKTSNPLSLLVKGLNYSVINFATVQAIIKKTDFNNNSLFISKATNINEDHTGGAILKVNSAEYNIFSTLVKQLSDCDLNVAAVNSVEPLSDYERLRKLTLNLAGRIPTVEEETRIGSAVGSSNKEFEFSAITDLLMSEPYFYRRVKTMFNDKFLLDTNRTYIDTRNFAKKSIFTTQLSTSYPVAADARLIRNKYRYGLIQAPLELIAHVVRKNRPFTEILTANYTMVNSYTATLFNAVVKDATGVVDTAFNFVPGELATLRDKTDFREAKITNDKAVKIPHAGIMSTLSFLARYPSTNTNKNRGRSRYVYDYFLDINVEGLASRDGLKLNNVSNINGPYTNPQCKSCHDTVDPVAGAFKNWSNLGSYTGDNTSWFNVGSTPSMLPPGLGINSAIPLPAGRSADALQWLAETIITDNAFAVSVVKIVFKGLTGQDFGNDVRSQEAYKTDFVQNNFNLKTLVKAIVNDKYFLAMNASSNVNIDQLAHLGMAKLLTPDQLHRRLVTLTGRTWVAPKSRKTLLDKSTYQLLYGGIDSQVVTIRTTQPTSLIAGIQQRIANQTACKTVTADFRLNSNRLLFPQVEITDTPETVAGAARIKGNIVYLFKHILGEKLTVTDAEVIRIFKLYTDVRALSSSNNIPVACQNGLLANNPIILDADVSIVPWMAVVTYLLSDFHFLYD